MNQPYHSIQPAPFRQLGSVLRIRLAIILTIGLIILGGCQKSSRDESALIHDQITKRTLNSEPLRQGLRNLMQTTLVNKPEMEEETRVLINAWLKSFDSQSIAYQPTNLLDALSDAELAEVGCQSPDANQLSAADVECLYEDRLMRKLSDWVLTLPIKDKVFSPMLDKKLQQLNEEQTLKLQQAFKLFDWTIRNIKLMGVESSQSNVRTRDPRMPLSDSGAGYTYLPWQATVYSQGDFVTRGRVFGALATQQGIDTCWISVGSAPGIAGDLFAMGILVNDQLLLVDPKLGIPILDPDTDDWATIQDVAKNERILKRLNLPQYEYALQQPDIKSVQLLVDATPFALSRRAKALQSSLLAEERMVVSIDIDALSDRLTRAAPNATVSIWNVPVLAQIYAKAVGERLTQISQFTMRYMAEHLIWVIEGNISTGRQLHLTGKFEKDLEGAGALRTYFDTRVDDESLKKMAYNPDVQNALGLMRDVNESQEQFDLRVNQAIAIFSRAKSDAAFMLAQLHFDRSDFKSCIYWLSERLLQDQRAARWHSAGWYLLARAQTEMGQMGEAEESLIKPTIDDENKNVPAYAVNPQDAGNRIRLRYLRRLAEQTAE